ERRRVIAWPGLAGAQSRFDRLERGFLAIILDQAISYGGIVEPLADLAFIECSVRNQLAEIERALIQLFIAASPLRFDDLGAFTLERDQGIIESATRYPGPCCCFALSRFLADISKIAAQHVGNIINKPLCFFLADKR